MNKHQRRKSKEIKQIQQNHPIFNGKLTTYKDAKLIWKYRKRIKEMAVVVDLESYC